MLGLTELTTGRIRTWLWDATHWLLPLYCLPLDFHSLSDARNWKRKKTREGLDSTNHPTLFSPYYFLSYTFWITLNRFSRYKCSGFWLYLFTQLEGRMFTKELILIQKNGLKILCIRQIVPILSTRLVSNYD